MKINVHYIMRWRVPLSKFIRGKSTRVSKASREDDFVAIQFS